MKITAISTFIVDAGWRPWIFVKIEADDGTVGYGECSDGRSPHGIVSTIRDMSDLLIGADPTAFEMRYWDMMRRIRQSLSPPDMCGIQKSRPVHRTNDNRLTGTQQHIANGLQRIVNADNRFDPAAAKRMPLGRGYIKTERGQPQITGLFGGICVSGEK